MTKLVNPSARDLIRMKAEAEAKKPAPKPAKKVTKTPKVTK